MTEAGGGLVRPDLRTPRNWKWGSVPPDVLPLWLADMDLPPPPAVREGLAALARDGWLGYEMVPGDAALRESVRRWLAARGHPGLADPLELVLGPGVLPLLYAAVRAHVPPGGAVVVPTPAYPPFFSAARDQDRRVVEVPMREADGRVVLDVERIAAALAAGARAVLLCQPHNPTGRVFTRDELAAVAEAAARFDAVLLADEVWADLWYDAPPLPVAAASDAAAERTLTIVGPCKSYNIAGLPIGAAVSAEPELLAPLVRLGYGLGHPGQGPVAMWDLALRVAQPWLEATRATLRARRDRVVPALAELGVAVRSPEATYLAWLDGRRHPLGDRLAATILEHGRVLLNDGRHFGAGGAACARLNFATTDDVLDEALARLRRVLAAS